MAVMMLKDARTYWAGADLTGQSNQLSLMASVDEEDSTTFANNGWKGRVATLFGSSASVEGFWAAGDAGQPDDRFFADLAAASVPLTVVPTSGAVSSVAYVTRAVETRYSTFGNIGSLMPFAVDTVGDGPLVRGVVMHPQGTARTATGNGTGIQIGALSATQRMWANLHVFSVSGTGSPTLTVKLQSSVDNTFASPTDRVTFTAATAISGEQKTVTGAVADAWWRVVWTISGTSPSFLFNCSAGIGPL